MAKENADRNLLFGILALQMDFISRDQLVAGLNAWVLRKNDPLAQVLVDQGALAERDRAVLEPMIALHVERHGGDPERSLQAAAAELSTRLPSRPVEDAEVIAAMQTIVRARGGADVSTIDRPSAGGTDADANAGRAATSAGRFIVLRHHARGGLGNVYVARDTEVNREVALKEIQEQFADDAESRARFLVEAEVTGALEHPGIVPVYGLGRHADGRPFYAMRFIKGDSLKDAIQRFHEADRDPRRDSGERALDLQKLLRRFLDVCEAIQYAHDRGVLHRDLKPGNVMVGRYGETLVVDWGLAKVVGRHGPASADPDEATIRPSGSAAASATVAGRAMGTPQYMSPEQAEGRLEDLGPPSDVYCLGATLYCLLTGRAPFSGDDTPLILARVAAGEFPRPREANARVPHALDAVCLKAMALSPPDRYGSARALAADLERWLADEPVAAAPDPLWHRLARWVRRHRSAAQATAAAVAAIMVVLVAALAIVDKARRGERERRLEATAAKKRAETAERVALDEKNTAERERQRADLARADAVRKGHELERQAAELLLDRGLVECEAGRANRGILWLARALDQVPPGEEALRQLVGANLASWASEVPPLAEQFPHEKLDAVAVSPDGKLILTGGEDNTARFWDAATGESIGVPLKHRGAVVAAAFSPDGKSALTGSFDGTERLWAVPRGNPIGAAIEHPLWGGMGGGAMTFSPDGRTIVTGGNKTARLWDAATGRPIGAPMEHDQGVNAAAFSPNSKVVITGSHDQTARLWDAATGLPLGPPPLQHRGFVYAVAFSPDGGSVLTGSADNTAQLWDAATGKPAGLPLPHSGSVVAVAFRPDGKAMVTASGPGTARLWDRATGKPIGAAMEHRETIWALALSPDGKTILTGSQDNTARLWDSATGRPISPPLEHLGLVHHLTFSPDGTFVVTAADRAARLWDIAASASRGLSLQQKGGVFAVAFAHDGRSVVTGGSDNRAHIWDSATGRPIGAPLEHRSMVFAISFGRDGNTLRTLSTDDGWRLWNAATGEPVGSPVELRGQGGVGSFSPDGKSVLIGGFNDTARLWDAETAQAIGSPFKHPGADRGAWAQLTAVAFAPDGNTIVTVNNAGTGVLFDLATDKPIGARMEHGAIVQAAVFSPDNQTVVTGGYDGKIQRWDARTGKPVGMPMVHRGIVSAVVFSRDGKVLLSGSSDNTARLWNASTGEAIGRPLEHRGPVLAVIFSPDERTVLTGSQDATARRWDSVTGRPFGPPMWHRGPVRAVAFSPDGQSVLTGSDDQTARLWRIGPASDLALMSTPAWGQAVTGLKLDEEGGLQVLDVPSWRSARAVARGSR